MFFPRPASLGACLAMSTACLALAGGAAARRPAPFLEQPDDWFRGEEGRRITANILSHQSPQGGWPKNLDTTRSPYTGDRAKIQGTFDNGATTDELRYLARAYAADPRPEYRTAVEKGLDHILEAQYPTGGWPQFHPPDRACNNQGGFG